MGSQTNGKAPALPYFTVGADLFDHPSWDGLTLAHAGLWTFLNTEACRTRGLVSAATAQKAAAMGRGAGRVTLLFAAMVAAGLLVDVGDGWYRIAGWDKYQVEPPSFATPEHAKALAAERQRRYRQRHRNATSRATSDVEGEGEGEGEVLREPRAVGGSRDLVEPRR